MPAAALHDDALSVLAEHVAPVGGAPNAEGLAPELGGVEAEGNGESLGELAGVVCVPHSPAALAAGEEVPARQLPTDAAEGGGRVCDLFLR
mgnify:CR=1 FL=1